MAAFFGAEEIWSRHDEDGREPVLLAGVRETSGQTTEEEFEHSLQELSELAKACMMEPLGTFTQLLPKVNAGLYVGTGKAEEIRAAAEETEARRVIFNDTLSPSQIRNLQKTLKLPVMDRTALILEIFERRARTREAKLQVELAKLRYLKPRLIGMWETQNRQGGASGAMSAKGEGETQLEIDRRTIDHRLTELRWELKAVGKERETQRKRRQNSGLPMVALIGYTNAGKSTIMNAMLDRYPANASTQSTPERPASSDKRKVLKRTCCSRLLIRRCGALRWSGGKNSCFQIRSGSSISCRPPSSRPSNRHSRKLWKRIFFCRLSTDPTRTAGNILR